MRMDWILMAPQYHAAMAIVALIILVLVIRIDRRK